MKVLVCGGRDFDDTELLTRVLDEIHAQTPITFLIHGGAKGADVLAFWWADAKRIPTKSFPAQWSKYKRAAGPIRNTKMLVEGRPDLIVAFPGHTGTANMIDQGRLAAIKTLIIKAPATCPN